MHMLSHAQLSRFRHCFLKSQFDVVVARLLEESLPELRKALSEVEGKEKVTKLPGCMALSAVCFSPTCEYFVSCGFS